MILFSGQFSIMSGKYCDHRNGKISDAQKTVRTDGMHPVI